PLAGGSAARRVAAEVPPHLEPDAPPGPPRSAEPDRLLRHQRVDERAPGSDPVVSAPPAEEGRAFGSGWISGAMSALLGPMSFGAVVCLRFPQYLTSPHLRDVYPMGFIRALIHVCLVAAFVLGVVSVTLRRSKWLGGSGIAFTVMGALLGGSEAAAE